MQEREPRNPLPEGGIIPQTCQHGNTYGGLSNRAIVFVPGLVIYVTRIAEDPYPGGNANETQHQVNCNLYDSAFSG